MEIQVTQEQVDAVVESIVRKELNSLEVYDGFYEEYRKKPLGEYIEHKVDSMVEDYLKKKIDNLVDTEVAEEIEDWLWDNECGKSLHGFGANSLSDLWIEIYRPIARMMAEDMPWHKRIVIDCY